MGLSCSLSSQKLPVVPKENVNITEEELVEYPLLKKGKKLADKHLDEGRPSKMSISAVDWLRIEDFFDKKGLRTIEFEGIYYEFELKSNLRVKKCFIEITEEELADCPDLKKAIELANKSEKGQVTLKLHPNERWFIEDFLNEKGSDTIKIDDNYYKVWFPSDIA